MGLVEKNQLVAKLSPPMDYILATKLVDEFTSIERRYIQRDWEPTQLDAGQFAEISSRILYHQDSGNLNHTKSVSDCLGYLWNDTLPHQLARKDAIHISKVIQTIYKFRSDRGAVHISPTYTPNHMDSKYLVEAVRWSMNELLRLFWTGDKEDVAKTIRELLQFDVPCIGVYGDIIIVQRTDLKTEEEVLVLLHYAGEVGFSRTEIGKHALSKAPAITTNLQKLCSPAYRQVVFLTNGRYRLTDLGSRRIREELADKLLLST
jgi:hypothetical protein